MRYEALMIEYQHLIIKEVTTLPKGLGGLHYDNEIEIDKHRSRYEKHGILGEEIGHYETTYGDITELSKIQNKKLEIIARRWGYEKIVSLDKLIYCYKNAYTTIEEVCTHLEITPDYLQATLKYYKDRYGLFTEYKNYKINFDPLYITSL